MCDVIRITKILHQTLRINRNINIRFIRKRRMQYFFIIKKNSVQQETGTVNRAKK